jgi:hypothetical protein
MTIIQRLALAYLLERNHGVMFLTFSQEYVLVEQKVVSSDDSLWILFPLIVQVGSPPLISFRACPWRSKAGEYECIYQREPF